MGNHQNPGCRIFAGRARDNVQRTLFAVGDEKHRFSRFKAQCAHKFAEMRGHFRAVHQASEAVFATGKLDFSFRSAVGVLDAVDAVFGSRHFAACTRRGPSTTLARCDAGRC